MTKVMLYVVGMTLQSLTSRCHLRESEFSDFMIEYLWEIKTEFEHK